MPPRASIFLMPGTHYTGGQAIRFDDRHSGLTGLLDPSRSLRMCTFRAIQAPLISTAWGVFDRVVPWKGPAGVVAKVAHRPWDQSVARVTAAFP